MVIAWTQFLALGAVIAVAGFWLSRFGDMLAERLGLSGSWIGLVLLATVTSLPELVTGVSSVAVVNAPNLAVGNVLGACLFNLLLLAVVGVFYRPVSMFTRVSQGHALSTGYGAVLLGIVGLNLLVPSPWPNAPIGPATVLIVPLYLLALRTIFNFERRRLMEPAEPSLTRHPGVTLAKAASGYGVAAVFLVAAALALPRAALGVGEAMGWSNSFVGTIFLAATTSLPELAVTLSAIRIGAIDMAVANLLGSNLFNMVVLAVDDIAYPAGPLLSSVTPVHLTSVLAALVMNGIVTAGLIYRPSGRPAGAVSWISLALIATYAINALLLFASATPTG